MSTACNWDDERSETTYFDETIYFDETTSRDRSILECFKLLQYRPVKDFSELVGHEVLDVEVDKSASRFVSILTKEGVYKFFGVDDYSDTRLIDVAGGSLKDLIGETILEAVEISNKAEQLRYGEQKWTFYHIRTNKESLTMRWLGDSSGYYSVDIDVFFLPKDKNPEIADLIDTY